MATAATRRRKNLVEQERKRILLTPTGLLMEGDFDSKSPASHFERNGGCFNNQAQYNPAVPILSYRAFVIPEGH
jgi:hypothetical protein